MTIKHLTRLSILIGLLLCPALCGAITLKENVHAIETEIAGRIGVSVLNTASGDTWSFRGDERFAMMSTFKALACARLFHLADVGQVELNAQYPILKNDLVVWSPVTRKLIGKNISLKDACEATMLTSDNTAANIVLQGIGGPASLTAFLKSIGDNVTRLDRIEPHLNEAKPGDQRDTTSPNAMVRTLNNILLGDVISDQFAQTLQSWMRQNEISGKLLRSVLPSEWSIADRTGSGENGSRGITAMVWKDKQPPLILAIYITETDLSHAQRNEVIARIGTLLFEKFGVD